MNEVITEASPEEREQIARRKPATCHATYSGHTHSWNCVNYQCNCPGVSDPNADPLDTAAAAQITGMELLAGHRYDCAAYPLAVARYGQYGRCYKCGYVGTIYSRSGWNRRCPDCYNREKREADELSATRRRHQMHWHIARKSTGKNVTDLESGERLVFVDYTNSLNHINADPDTFQDCIPSYVCHCEDGARV